ncbi:MAG: DNA polymerase IV [Bdellovibrionaceae bacterium]|nr:DNA polymerase IV [Pseudobdellovibrionaceae bacterium]
MSKIKKIIHVDQDCFYAAVEVRDNPSLKGKPVAVGGAADRRGVLTTANYEARKFGVRSAMPTSQALKLCPNLILVPVHMEKYRIASRKIRAIFKQFTSQIEPLSLDEAYLDVTDCTDFNGSATLIAKEIRSQIFATTKLTASAGIASNKFLAKIASDWKKPNAQFTISPNMVEPFVKNLKIEKIPGVGKVTAQKMHNLNIKTCADLQKWKITDLHYQFGKWGIKLFDLCRGKDDRLIVSSRVRKSLSVENTYNKDLQTLNECLKKVPSLFDNFKQRLLKTNLENNIHSLFVKIKFYDFKQTTLELSSTKTPSVEIYSKMVEKAFMRKNKPVRLLGVGVKFPNKTKPKSSLQLELF